jgi:hypothetical protein
VSGGLARLVRRRAIPGGQGRESQHYVPQYREPPAKLRAALQGQDMFEILAGLAADDGDDPDSRLAVMTT